MSLKLQIDKGGTFFNMNNSMILIPFEPIHSEK